jgi:hypothetical protein
MRTYLAIFEHEMLKSMHYSPPVMHNSLRTIDYSLP